MMAFINTVISQKNKLTRNEAQLPVCFLTKMQLYFKNVHGICNYFTYMKNYITISGIVELYRNKLLKQKLKNLQNSQHGFLKSRPCLTNQSSFYDKVICCASFWFMVAKMNY